METTSANAPTLASSGSTPPAGGMGRSALTNGATTNEGASEPDTDNVPRGTLGLKAELDDLVMRLPTLTADAATQAKTEFLDAVERSKSAARGVVDDLRDQVDQRVQSTVAYVKERPLHSVGVGVGIGIVLGIVMSRRGRSDRHWDRD
jgi:ElaB/YqjD/DUF883 family membrane-anchored ribosome-binding protein